MKLVAGQFKDYNPFKGKEEIQFVDLTLHCKTEAEFLEAWEKIKDIDGVEWVGCPDHDDESYIDMVASFKRKNFDTNSEMYDQQREVRNEIERALNIGKHRKKS